MTEYIVNAQNGWGKGHHETDALCNAVPHMDTASDAIDVTIIEVEGFIGFNGRTLSADEILSEEELTLDGDDVTRLRELVKEAELLSERVLVEASE